MDVCVLGRIGYDLHAVEHGRPLAQVENFSRHVGGSSANIAIGLARLGLGVGIISCLGKDPLANYLLDFLRQERVDTQFVRLIEGYNTSLCLTEVCPPDRFTQVFYRREAADTQVRFGPAEKGYLERAQMFVSNGTSLAASPAREATLEALQAARAAGLRTVFDVDYRASSWSSAEEASRVARSALPWVDIILANEDELSIATGQVGSQAQVAAALAAGVKVLVHKLGSNGVQAYTPGQLFTAQPFSTQVVSTIGAGDGFAAGFLYALHRGLSLPDCLQYGNAAAAVVVSRVSCSDAMPQREELENMLRARIETE